MAPPGLSALGCQGSACDRLTPYRRVEGSRPRELYSIAALVRWAPFRAPFFYAAFGGENWTTGLRPRKTGQPRSARGNAFPLLVAGATTLPSGKHVTGFAGRLQLPYESSSFATPASGGTITRAYCRACTCQQKLDTKLKKLGIKIEYLYKAQ